MKNLPYITLFLCMLTVQFICANNVNAKLFYPGLKKLVERLETDGIDKKYLQDLFVRDELVLMPKAVALSLTIKEASLNYSRFLEKKSVDRAVQYLNTHSKILNKIENHFNVSASVIVAILTVETACGKYTGSFNTFNVLVTQALSLEPEIYQQIYRHIPQHSVSEDLAQESADLLDAPELRSWLPTQSALEPYVKEILEARESPLVLSRHQQDDRLDGVKYRLLFFNPFTHRPLTG